MKRILSLLLFMLLVSTPVFANQAKPSGTSGFITVTASRTEEVKPNIATITFYVETSNKVSDNAVKENKDVSGMISPMVEKYIREHQLYI